EILIVINKFLGITAVADIGGRRGLAPDHAHTAPACGHGVPLVCRAGRNQHPLFADHFERVKGLLCNVDLGKSHNFSLLWKLWRMDNGKCRMTSRAAACSCSALFIESCSMPQDS